MGKKIIGNIKIVDGQVVVEDFNKNSPTENIRWLKTLAPKANQQNTTGSSEQSKLEETSTPIENNSNFTQWLEAQAFWKVESAAGPQGLYEESNGLNFAIFNTENTFVNHIISSNSTNPLLKENGLAFQGEGSLFVNTEASLFFERFSNVFIERTQLPKLFQRSNSTINEVFIDGDAGDNVNVTNLNLGTEQTQHVANGNTYAHYNYRSSDLYIEINFTLNGAKII